MPERCLAPAPAQVEGTTTGAETPPAEPQHSGFLFEDTDWTFDTLDRTYDAIQEIALGDLGLDVYPNQVEIIHFLMEGLITGGALHFCHSGFHFFAKGNGDGIVSIKFQSFENYTMIIIQCSTK